MGEKYRILFESSRDAIMLLSPPDWFFTVGNKATLEMFGAKDEKDFASKTPGDLSPEYQPDRQLSSEKAREAIGKAMRDGSFFFEWTYKKFDGEEFSSNVLLTRVEWEGNQLLTATVRDITESKKKEKELQRYRDHLEKIVEERTIKLQESEAKYRSFFRTSKDCIFITSKEGEWLDMSDSAPEFFGYENREELEKVKIINLYENSADRKKYTRQIENQGFTKDFAVNLQKKDGTVINVLITSVLIKDDKGEMIALQGSIRDITVQKEVEKQLNREKELLTALIDNSPDNIYFKDKKSRFIRLSKNHIEKFGIKDPKEAIGKTDFDFFSDEHANEAYEDEQEVMRTGKPLVAKEEKETWPDGSVTWASSTKLPLYDTERNIIGTCGITRDITARKYAAKALKESEKNLKELNASKDKFFSIISHDLRSPFNSIIGFSEMLCNEIEAFNKAEIKEMAKSIYITSQETYNLLNNLLEWSGTQTGRIKIEPAITGIYDIAISTVSLLNDTAKNKNIDVSIDIPEHLQVFADINMMTAVIRNLLANAIKFTHEKGSIKIGAKDSGKAVKITITDTGVGIKKEDIDNLFRIDADFSTKGTANEKGTGLGLIICKEFIALNNGDIRVESEIGKGSRFIVTLPAPSTQF